MNSEKYIGLDVHQATISVAVMDSQGKVVMESILETKASTLLEFFAGLRGSLFVTFEEGTWAAWLYDLLKPHVTEVLVCNPRKNALLKQGNKSDKIDARKLAERLRLHDLKPVYHGETGVRMLRELARSYLTVVKDLSRVMNRLKALYRSWAIPCAGRDVYYTRHRSQWLEKIPEAGTRRRAEQLYQQLDMLQHLRQQARRELLAEGRKHFHAAHQRLYSYCDRGEQVQLVNLRVAAIGQTEHTKPRLLERGPANPKAAQKSERKVRFQESNDVQTSPIYERDRLLAGNEVTGPAVIEQADSTTLVPPSFKALVDPHGRLIMTQKAVAKSRISRSTGQRRPTRKSLAR